jgi:hypothetical protein
MTKPESKLAPPPEIPPTGLTFAFDAPEYVAYLLWFDRTGGRARFESCS